MSDVAEFRWASDVGAHSMPYSEELEYLGFSRYWKDGREVRDPRYPHSILMRRDG